MRHFTVILVVLGLVACGAPAETAATTETDAAPAAESAADAAESAESTAAEAAETAETEQAEEPAAEEAAEKPDSYYVDKVAELQTDLGTIAIRFYPDVAPGHVRNFIDLSESGFYTGTKFHRIIPGFVIQGGDPNTKDKDRSTWGTGSSGKRLKAEFNSVHHARGILSMARAQDPDSASSQFFVCVADAGALDNKYTVFGKVVSGMDVVDKIVNGPAQGQIALEPVTITGVTMRDATDAEKGPAPK
jgi:peptidyl-prolyl cis-trans isomerase B (cyclophilin B)